MYEQELTIPENVSVEVSVSKVKVKGQKGELEKSFELMKDMKIEKDGKKIKVSCESDRKKERALVGTFLAHIRNMVNGVANGYTYKLRVVYSHFPITVKLEKGKVIIQNFLGERKNRTADIVGKTDVKIQESEITVSGIDIDEVSQTAANIERATRIVGYDKKIFQDGVYIVSKGE